MEHLKALVIKFIMCTAVLWIVLRLIYGVSFSDVLTIGIVLTGLSYLIGDLYILPRFENWGATLADFGLAFFGVWLLGSYLIEINIPLVTASLLSATGIAIGEYFFHKYMANRVLDRRPFMTDREEPRINEKLQTEFSTELDNTEPQKQNNEDNR